MERDDYAEYYDYDHTFQFDLGFYLNYASQNQPPILELACGTGRLTLPLAQAGFEVYGVDISENMLELCRQGVMDRNLSERVHLIQADMASFKLPRNDFGMAFIALRSFMHLLKQSDQIACLQRVHNHLRPESCLIIDIIAPDVAKLAQKPDPTIVVRREFDLPNGNHVIRYNRMVNHDPANQIRYFEFLFKEYTPSGELTKTKIVPITTRYSFRYEMELLLESTGFETVDIFRDHDMNPYDGTGEMILVAKRS